MLIFLCLLAGFQSQLGISLAPSYIIWEGLQGEGFDGGIFWRTNSLPVNLNCGVSAGIQGVELGSFAYKTVGVSAGAEYPAEELILGAGMHFEKSFGWEYYSWELTGVSGITGFYAKILYNLFTYTSVSANIGISYHNYFMFKDFTQLRGDIETMWNLGGTPKHKSPPLFITEPVGGFVGGAALAGLGVLPGYAVAFVSGSGGMGLGLVVMAVFGISGYVAGIPLGINFVNTRWGDKKGSFKKSLIGSVAGGVGLIAIMASRPSTEVLAVGYSLPLAGALIGYNFK